METLRLQCLTVSYTSGWHKHVEGTVERTAVPRLQHLEEDDTEAPHVGLVVVLTRPSALLRCDVRPDPTQENTGTMKLRLRSGACLPQGDALINCEQANYGLMDARWEPRYFAQERWQHSRGSLKDWRTRVHEMCLSNRKF